jgi:acyl transferase domain-containing protein/NADPH:quinone reductase-like Zn-dependent oxidoreductase/thioesterase domain-containing protein/NADP-dependent 3-hydroxy acid dehydrogenase YdfG/acyl carrier protein
MGCRFPAGADTPDRFFDMLLEKRDAIREIPAERWSADTYFSPEPGIPGRTYVRHGGFVEDVDLFEPECFRISPREAQYMDPQQRLLLEVTWDAFQQAGLPMDRVNGSRTGVFVGVSTWDYSHIQTSDTDFRALSPFSAIGTSLAITANRLSYVFDLNGPSMAVDTACSSALVAIDRAVNSLHSEQCRMAVAGGVNLLLAPETFVAYSAATLLSPDGHCKAFDAAANGFVRSEGAGVVVLKRLSDAERDGDNILAVLQATGLNQDGRTDGIAFPSAGAQRALLEQVYGQAGIDPAEVAYVEAHGTGTAAGDPVEAGSVGGFFAEHLPAGERLLLGSLKTNFGHLEAASGVASVIKVIQSVRHRMVPPNLHFNTPNPKIDFDGLRLTVPIEPTPWPERAPVAYAGTNSFGFGGANAHLLIGAYQPKRARQKPRPAPAQTGPRLHLLPLTARSEAALKTVAGEIAALLRREDAPPLANICYTAAERRTLHDERLAFTVRDVETATSALEIFAAGEMPDHAVRGHAAVQAPEPVLVFSGQGTQWARMGKELMRDQPVFAEVMRRCDAVFRAEGAPWSLFEEIGREPDNSRLQDTSIAQPAIFAIQAGLFAFWRHLGLTPAAVMGHSIGEVAAAHAAGIFNLEEAARLAFHRGRSMGFARDGGKMLAADLSEAEGLERLVSFGGQVSLGAVNGPSAVTFAGRPDDIAALEAELEAERIWCRRLNVNNAFHSSDMDAAESPLMEALDGLTPASGSQRTFVSTVTGGVLDASALDVGYWWTNIRQPVRFYQAMQALMARGHDLFVEVGPHPALLQSMLQCAGGEGRRITALPSMRRDEAQVETIYDTLGALFAHGVELDLSALRAPGAAFVQLPPHPWNRSRYWNEAASAVLHAIDMHPLLGRRLPTRDPTWRQALDLRLVPYLSDHRVEDRVVLPGAALVEMALSAARAVLGETVCELEQVRFTRALILPEGTMPIIETRVDSAAGRIEIASAVSDEDTDWTVHFTAIFGTADAVTGAPSEDTGTGSDVPVDALYDDFAQRGLRFGEKFRLIRTAQTADGAARARVALDTGDAAGASVYHMHPALLDGCFQVLSATLPEDAGEGLYLPERIDRIVFGTQAATEVTVQARLRMMNSLVIDGDLHIANTNGLPLIRVEGFRARKAQFAGRTEDTSLDACRYEERWEPCPLVAADAAAAPDPEAVWLLFDEGSVLSSAVAEGLAARGGTVVRLRAAEKFLDCGEGRFDIAPGAAEDIAAVLSACTGDQLHRVKGVVDLWALAETEPQGAADLKTSEARLCHSLMHLVQALDARGYDVPIRLVVATQGARQVATEPPSQACQQALLTGFCRVLARELRHYELTLVDLDPATETPDAASLLAEIRAPADEQEVALRDGKRWVPRLDRAEGERVHIGRDGAALSPPVRLEPARRGALGGLDWHEARRATPGSGEVEIAISHVGLNFRDVLKALGIYPADTPVDTMLGDECVGTVLTVGGDVTGVRAGDQVIAFSPGSLGSHAIVGAGHVIPLPPHFGPAEAATLPVAFLTAHHALHNLARIREGDSILIHSAAGGVGMAALQLAAKAGATIFATAGSDEKRALVRTMGAAHVMHSRTLAFAEKVKTLTDGRGVDIILNSLSGRAMQKSLECLAPYGRFLELGKRDIHGGTRIDLWPFRNNIAYYAIDLAEVLFERSPNGAEAINGIAGAIADHTIEPLPHQVYPATAVVEAFRAMSQGRHTGKIVIDMCAGELDAQRAPAGPLDFEPEATWLITGGLGGFGLDLAHYLVDHGARHLALLGRRPPSEAAQSALDELRAKGVRVETFACDVADEDGLSATFAAIAGRMPPLRGIFHLAGVLEDGILLNLSPDRFSRATGPKALGAWNLHRLTRDMGLEHFVMFGSISAAIGNPGQANYAAANAFLEALAGLRRAEGLPAKAIAWGMLRDTGMTAGRDGLARLSEKRGLAGMGTDECLSLLPALLRRTAPTSIAARFDWAAFSRAFPQPRTGQGLLSALTTQTESAEALGGEELVQTLIDSAPGERLDQLQRYIADHVARILGATADDIDPERPLHEHGFDSLMLVELALTIQDDFGSRLSSASVSPSVSIRTLATTVADKLDKADEANAEIGEHKWEAANEGDICAAIVMRQADAGTPLFMIHPLGVHEGVYRPLVNALSPNHPVYGISSNVEASAGDTPLPIDTRVDAFVETIREIQPHGPYLLCGYSMGGHLALKTAAQLEALGETVDFVGLIEWELELAAVAADVTQTQRQAANLFVAVYRLLETRFGILAHLPQDRLAREAAEVARRMTAEVEATNVSIAYEWMVEKGYLIKNVSRDLLEGYFGQLFVNFVLLAGDSPVRPVKAPVYVWRARDGLGAGNQPWTDVVSNLRSEEVVDGDHFSLMMPPSCTVLARRINECLSDAALLEDALT